MDNHIITKCATVVPYAYEYVSKFWQEHDHICRIYTAIRGTVIQHKNTYAS